MADLYGRIGTAAEDLKHQLSPGGPYELKRRDGQPIKFYEILGLFQLVRAIDDAFDATFNEAGEMDSDG